MKKESVYRDLETIEWGDGVKGIRIDVRCDSFGTYLILSACFDDGSWREFKLATLTWKDVNELNKQTYAYLAPNTYHNSTHYRFLSPEELQMAEDGILETVAESSLGWLNLDIGIKHRQEYSPDMPRFHMANTAKKQIYHAVQEVMQHAAVDLFGWKDEWHIKRRQVADAIMEAIHDIGLSDFMKIPKGYAKWKRGAKRRKRASYLEGGVEKQLQA